jgi:uncharacterized protein (DUF58 family)
MQIRPKTDSSPRNYRIADGPYTDIGQLTQLRYAAREIDLVAMSKAINPLSGLLTSNFRGRGIDFAEVRVYQPGDDVRTIDWRVTARTRKPHTKLFQEEKERPVLLIVDQSASMFFGSKVTFKSVIAAEAAALIAWTALEGGDRVGGLVFSDTEHSEVRPRRNKRSVLRLLREIHAFNHVLGKNTGPGGQSTEPDDNRQDHQNTTFHHRFNNEAQRVRYLASSLGKIRQVARHGSTLFIISDFLNFDAESHVHLNQLARHNDLVGIHISDNMERDLPPPNQYVITDGKEKTRINTANRRHRDLYSAHFASHLQSVHNEFTRVKAPFFELLTHEPVTSALPEQYARYLRAQRKPARRQAV